MTARHDEIGTKVEVPLFAFHVAVPFENSLDDSSILVRGLWRQKCLSQTILKKSRNLQKIVWQQLNSMIPSNNMTRTGSTSANSRLTFPWRALCNFLGFWFLGFMVSAFEQFVLLFGGQHPRHRSDAGFATSKVKLLSVMFA